MLTDFIIINESLIISDAIKFNINDKESYNKSLLVEDNQNLNFVHKEEKDNFLLKFTSAFVVQNDYKYRTLRVM